MNGRLENQNKTEEYLKRIIEHKPDVIKDYYLYLNDKTHHTKRTYIMHILRFLDYLHSNNYDIYNTNMYQNIRLSAINRYIENVSKKDDGSHVSDAYKMIQVNAIKSFFDFLYVDGVISDNPCKKLKSPRTNKQISVTYLTPEEIQIVKENIKNGVGNEDAKSKQKEWFERDYAIIYLALCTGLRVSALTEINIDDIDFSNHTIRVTEKENFTKDIYINDKVEEALHVWIEKRKILMNGYDDDNALFISHLRKRISTKSVNALVKKYTYNIDKKITAHKLRSTFAMNVYEATGDIYITSSLLGHANVETTKKYAAVTDKKRKQAIENMMKNM